METWPDAFHWWIDSVGGFLVFTKNRVLIGQLNAAVADVGLMANVSSRHCVIARGDSGALLEPIAQTKVNGSALEGSTLLDDGDKIGMGTCELLFRKPQPWSNTVCLQSVGPRRFETGIDGVLLLADTCVLGSRPDAHIQTPWTPPVTLMRHRGTYWLRAPGKIWIDDKEYVESGPLRQDSRVQAEWGAFRVEPKRV